MELAQLLDMSSPLQLGPAPQCSRPWGRAALREASLQEPLVLWLLCSLLLEGWHQVVDVAVGPFLLAVCLVLAVPGSQPLPFQLSERSLG